MKQYAKYFRPGQKILLKNLDAPTGLVEFLTVFFHDHGEGTIDLKLPYQNREGEGFPFAPGMRFELSSDALGMGVRLQVSYQQETENREVIRVAIESELQIFQRRTQRRIDLVTGLRYSRGQGTLRTFREQWKKNVELLQKADPATLPAFPETTLNLSTGGIRFSLAPPVEKSNLFLILFQLEQGTTPICTLAETVWIGGKNPAGLVSVGMQFLCINESDRQRIETFVKKHIPPAT